LRADDPVKEVEQYARTVDAMRNAVEHSPRLARRKPRGGRWWHVWRRH
jgi:hypothetical protein